jgi:SSS family solute:Na+ symporter
VAEGVGLVSIANWSQQGFKNGFSFIWLNLAGLLLINVPLFGILGLGIKRYRSTQVQTLPQYYEMRYSRAVRVFAGVTLALGGVINMAVFPVVESQFLLEFLRVPDAVVLHTPLHDFRLFHVVLLVILSLGVFFTFIGGMVTMIVTEYLQSILILASITIISVLAVKTAGLASMKQAIDTHLGAAAFNPLSSDGIGPVFVTVWMLGMIVQMLAFPPALQKMSAAKSPEVARKMFLLSVIFGQGRSMMFVVWGVAALAVFGPLVPAGYDPVIYGRVVGGRFISMITDGVPLLKGLALAGFVFASISLNNGYMLSWSSVIANDCVAAARRKPMSQRSHLLLLRLACAGVALFIFAFGCWYSPKETIVQFFLLTGTIFGACGLITWFGLYWRRATAGGAWACLATGLLLPLSWLIFQKYFSDGLAASGRSYARWLNNDTAALVATVVPALCLIGVSLVTRPSGEGQLLSPAVQLDEQASK